MSITLTWEDCALLVVLLYAFYKAGYADGRAYQKHKQHQLDLEKSGNFFWAFGKRVEYPPMPKVNKPPEKP